MHTHIDHKILLKYTGLVKRYYTFIKQRTGNIMEDAELYQNNNSIQKHDAVETLEKYKNIQWRANASILDVGCGDGSVMTTVLMKYLPSDFQKLIGCDVSKNMLTFAREKYADERTDFILLDIEGDLPEELRQGFDHVFSNYALHWVKDDVRAFQNIYDLLKEDGSCLLITLGKHTPFDAFRIMSQRDKWKRYIHDPECIVSPYHDMKDPEIQIASVMKEIGFKNIEVKREKKTYNYDKAIHFMMPMTQVIAVAGEPVYLPCDISTQDEDDAVLLVLWYREDLGTPIYSVDARERDFGVAERWSDESVFASRAYFLPERRPAELGVDKVWANDQGIYRCRVDFKQAQTRNSRVNLTIIVPPNKMVITDDKGDVKQAIVGPYVEGDSFTLKCDVTGGRPRPWVKWFRDEVETDTPATPLQGNGVRGVIRVGPLTRADVRAALTCRASNHARAHPIETTLTLDMNFPPLTVHILGSNQPISASRRYDLLCQSSGSRPPASITWWKNGHRINNAKETLSTDGNTTTSTVSLQLNKNDAGARLACRASNPQMPSVPALEDDWTLDIQYVPETIVRLGTNLDQNNIREGSDVYFDCIIKAHPYVYKVEWRHNGKTLMHNVGQGVIISNQSLVLQGVGRKTAGNYTCVGFNAEGDGESKPFNLNVLYAPTCRSSQQRVHGVAKQELANITCRVDANPPEVTFRWTFNNTANSNEVSETYVIRAGTSSTVRYTPHTEMDYGTLLCWAHNRIGKQRVPCVYHIIAAGRPDQVHNCTVVNASLTSFGVRCSEGFNGGMPQSFLLEVREIVTQEIVANVSSPIPRFTAVGLVPGRTYAAAVLAYNVKGRGDPYPMRASTLRPPEKHHVHDKSLDLPRTAFQMSGAMSAAVGGGGILMVVIVLFMIAVRQRCAKRKPRSAPPPSSQPASPDKLREKDDSESDDRNPDIIPSDTDQMQMDYYRQQQVSTISPPPGSRGPRGSVAGVRGGLPGYCPLRTAPPPSHPAMHEPSNTSSGIPPPARFAAGSCTLPRGSTMSAPGDSRCGIPLQHLRTLPRPLPAPAPANLPRATPRDTPL